MNFYKIMSSNQDNISYSSVETQKQLRIEKVKKLRELGHNPFSVYSKRDFDILTVSFWFDFVHKFDFIKFLGPENDTYELDYFLQQVLFPRSLIEILEDKIHMRYTVREMGFDPDKDTKEFVDEFEPEMIEKTKKLLPKLGNYDEETRYSLLRKYLKTKIDDEDDDADEDSDLEITLKPNQILTLAGRIKNKRISGKIAFATIEDESCPEGFQFIFKADDLIDTAIPDKELTFEDLKNLIDEGDYIQATGKLDYSLRGEPSLFVQEYKILTKALRPLPEKLEYDNFEHRYKERVVDFKMNTKDNNGLSVREMIKKKSLYWQIWREEMLKNGFLEVECPIFEHIPGGADAKPFTTYYDLLDQDMYLRISLELPLKKLIAGGFEKVFEIGRIFRNEGSDPSHLQEYTQIEWYWAYTSYEDVMIFIQKIYRRLAEEIVGGLIQTDYKKNQINWGNWITSKECQERGWDYIDGWPAIPYFEAIRYFSNGKVDLENKTYQDLLEIAKENQIEIEKGIGYANLMDKIYKKTARINMIQPIFLIKQPAELEPLAKRDPKNPNLVHRWQVIVGGEEIGKAFSELNDPVDQAQRFSEQQKARDNGDEEAQFANPEFVEAMEYGMPPLSGFGVSERFFAFLLGKHIRECVTFPAVRLENNESGKKQK